MRARSSPAGSTAGSGGVGLLGRRGDRLSQDRTHDRDDVGGFRDERRALPQQVVAAFGARIERGARHREHFAARSSAKRAVINEPERRGSPEILTVWSG